MTEAKPTTALVRIKPGFFSDKEAAAIADAIMAALFPKAPTAPPHKPSQE